MLRIVTRDLNDISISTKEIDADIAVSVWILASGNWNDSGIWVDSANWID